MPQAVSSNVGPSCAAHTVGSKVVGEPRWRGQQGLQVEGSRVAVTAAWAGAPAIAVVPVQDRPCPAAAQLVSACPSRASVSLSAKPNVWASKAVPVTYPSQAAATFFCFFACLITFC